MTTIEIYMIRHPQASPPQDLPKDASDDLKEERRRVTATGYAQAAKRKKTIDSEEIDQIVCSPKPRTLELANAIVGERSIVPIACRRELFTPATGKMKESLDRLFNKHAHKPLSTYYADDPTDVEQMKKFGQIGWDAIIEEIEMADARKALVVGHGMYGVCFAYANNPELVESSGLMDAVQDECGGFVATLDDHYNIVDIKLLPSVAEVAVE